MEDKSNLRYTYHSRVRQAQRNIPSAAVSETYNSGRAVDYGYDTSTHYNQNFKVAVTQDKQVLTVMRNTRNTNFDKKRWSNNNFESLIYQVEVKNNDSAMCELAELYWKGYLGTVDVEKAHSLFLKAAEKGNSHAMCKLSTLYLEGDLGQRDKKLAIDWMEKAADHGNAFALAVTGQRLLSEFKEDKGKSCDEELKKKIVYYLEKAASKNSSRAMWTMGNIYEMGLLGEKNIQKAIEFYTKAGKSGSPASISSLHDLCKECLFSLEALEDILNGLVGYLSETSIAMLFQLGVSQLNSEVGFNTARGITMIELAALKQYDEAMIYLTKCYRDGKGCDENLHICQHWYHRLYSLYEASGKQGNIKSLWTVGMYHLKGYVGPIDLDKAEFYFKQVVSKSNDPDYIRSLANLYIEGRLGDKDPKIGEDMMNQVVSLLKQNVLKRKDVRSCLKIGMIYLDSKLSFASYKAAEYWFSKFINIIEEPTAPKDITLSRSFKIIEFMEKGHIADKKFVNWLQMNDNIENSKKDSEVSSKETNISNLKEENLINQVQDATSGIPTATPGSDIASSIEKEFNEFTMLSQSNLYLDDKLPAEHLDKVLNWILSLPEYIEKGEHYSPKCFTLLGNLYKVGKAFPLNLHESAKWLFIAESLSKKSIFNFFEENDDFSSVAKELYESEYIANELTRLTQKFQSLSSVVKYKVFSRILGDVFHGGFVAKRDLDKAIYWYSEASLKNNGRATRNLALIYHHDVSKKNKYRALKYYKLAIKQGSRISIEDFNTLIQENDEFKMHLPFLDKYQHKSSTLDIHLRDTAPFRNLSKYPRTFKEMFELAKSYLGGSDECKSNIYNAAYWFRKLYNRYGDFGSLVELFIIYKSGMLGSNVAVVSETFKKRILELCKKEMIMLKSGTDIKYTGNNRFLLLESILTTLKKASSETIFQEVVTIIESCLNSKEIDETILQTIIFKCDEYIDNSNQHLINNCGVE